MDITGEDTAGGEDEEDEDGSVDAEESESRNSPAIAISSASTLKADPKIVSAFHVKDADNDELSAALPCPLSHCRHAQELFRRAHRPFSAERSRDVAQRTQTPSQSAGRPGGRARRRGRMRRVSRRWWR